MKLSQRLGPLFAVLALAAALGVVTPARAADAINPMVSAAAESSHVFCDATGSVAHKPAGMD